MDILYTSATTCKLTNPAPIEAFNTGKLKADSFRSRWESEARAARVIGRIFALCQAGCVLRRVGACMVFAESLRRLVGRFCAKKSRGGNGPRPGSILSDSPL